VPSYAALSELLNLHGALPGVDRLAGANAVVFNFLVGNADAHAKNISLIHQDDGVRLAPLYDVVSTAAYPELSRDLAISIGDEFDPEAIGPTQWADLADDFGLTPGQFARVRGQLTERVLRTAGELRREALSDDWHHPCIDTILETIDARARASR
jgi:serine/threonine-protein kinase HipA